MWAFSSGGAFVEYHREPLKPAAAEPSISCIIPTLGRGDVLGDTIPMLLQQSWTPHEIIIVDQTPPHQTRHRRALKAWAGAGMIKWLYQSEPNASKARNAGAIAATGEVLLFLDDDIRIAPDFLSCYVETFVRTNAIGVTGPVLEGANTLTVELDSRAFTSQLGWLLQFPKNYAKECETSFMMSGNMAVRRDVFLALGGMDENYERGAYREESDFAMRFRRGGYSFRYSPRCSIVHLGPAHVPQGGARTWQRGREFWYFHHCVGDWYFNLGFMTTRTAGPLFARSLRHFVFNRQSLARPWRLPFALVFWLAGFPVAAMKRISGARPLCSSSLPLRCPDEHLERSVSQVKRSGPLPAVRKQNHP
jgi:GT2 family glycosyltransferase